MDNLYGLPVIGDQDTLSIVPAWSLQLARVIAARDAAIVAATGTVPEGDPDTVAGMVARLAALEQSALPGPWRSLPTINGWEPFPSSGALPYYSGVRVRRVPGGVQIQAMVRNGASGDIAEIPAGFRTEFTSTFPVSAGGVTGAQCSVAIGSTGTPCLRYSGTNGATFVAVDQILPTP